MGDCKQCLWDKFDGKHTNLCKDPQAHITNSGCIFGTPISRTTSVKQCLLCGGLTKEDICDNCKSK